MTYTPSTYRETTCRSSSRRVRKPSHAACRGSFKRATVQADGGFSVAEQVLQAQREVASTSQEAHGWAAKRSTVAWRGSGPRLNPSWSRDIRARDGRVCAQAG